MRHKRTLIVLTTLVLVVIAGVNLAALIVHDPAQTAMHRVSWVTQLQRMWTLRDKILEVKGKVDEVKNKVQAVRDTIQQMHELRYRQWDRDFKDIWGSSSGGHTVLRTTAQPDYLRQVTPWNDRIVGQGIFGDLNRVTRDARSDFERIREKRNQFGIRTDIQQYSQLPREVIDYYRSLGSLSSEGLFLASRSHDAAERLRTDAERLNEYARDTSPAGAAKTQTFTASVQAYAQSYQIELMNRILRQLAYQNMMKENEERRAISVGAETQKALANMIGDLPARTHLLR